MTPFTRQTSRHIADTSVVRDNPYTPDQIAQFNRTFDQKYGYLGHRYVPRLPVFRGRPNLDHFQTDDEMTRAIWAADRLG